MKIALTIPDELFEIYVKKFGLPKAYAVMRGAIDTFKDVDQNDRFLFLAGDKRREVEAVLGTTVDTPERLAKLVKNMCTVKIGNIEHSFTSEELARLSAQAGFHGRTLEVFMQEMIKEIVDMMLEKV